MKRSARSIVKGVYHKELTIIVYRYYFNKIVIHLINNKYFEMKPCNSKIRIPMPFTFKKYVLHFRKQLNIV